MATTLPPRLRGPDAKRARRLVIWEGVLNNVMGQMTGGIILSTFLKELDPGEGAVSRQGWLFASVYFASSLQVFGSYIISRTGDRKRVCIISMLGARIIWLMIAALALPAIHSAPFSWAWVLILANAISSFFGNVASIAWWSWVADLAPSNFWGRYIGRRNMIGLILSTPVGIAGGVLATYWKRHAIEWFGHHQWDLGGYGIIGCFGALCGLAAVVALSQVPALPIRTSESSQPRWFSEIASAFSNANFKKLLIARSWVGFFPAFGAPMWLYYATDVNSPNGLRMPVWIIKTWEGISSFANAHGNRVTGKLADFYGYRPIAVLWCIGMGTIPVWWLLNGRYPEESPTLANILHSGCLIGVLSYSIGSWSWAGVNLCASNLALKMAPREHNNVWVAFFQAITSLVAGVGSLLGGYLTDHYKATNFTLGFATISIVQIVFIISALGRWTSMVWLSLLDEQDAMNIRSFARALPGILLSRKRVMRTIRK